MHSMGRRTMTWLFLVYLFLDGLSFAHNPTLRFVFESPSHETIFGRGDVRMLEDMRALNQLTLDEKLTRMKTTTHNKWHQEYTEKLMRQWEKELDERLKTDTAEMRQKRMDSNDYGNLHVYYGRFERALKDYEGSLALSRKLEDKWSEAITLSNMGTVYHLKGEYDTAENLYLKGLAASELFEDQKLEGAVSSNLGALYQHRGLYARAASLYERSWELTKNSSIGKNQGVDVMSLGIILGNQALLYRDWGQYSKALQYYTRALQYKIRSGDLSGQGTTLADMAKVYQDWGQPSKSEEYFQKALAKKAEAQDKPGEAEILIRIGEFKAATGEYDDAMRFLNQGMAILKKLGIPTDGSEKLLAGICLDKGELDRAEALVKKSSDQGTRARLSLKKSDYSTAVKHFGKMLQTAQQNRNVDNLFVSYTGLGMAYESQRQLEDAEKYYKEAVLFTEELRSSLDRDQRQSFFDVRVNGFFRTAPYKGLARVMAISNKGSDAFKVSEFTKARVFSEAVSKRLADLKVDVPSDILKADEEINDQVSSLKATRRRGYENEDKVLVSNLDPQIERLEKKLHDHVEMLRTKHPNFAATRYPQPMELSQQALHDDDWVLAFDVSDSGVLIFLLKGRTLIRTEFKPIKRDELEGMVRKFRQPLEMVSGTQLSEKLRSFDFKTGKDLFDLLLGDMLGELPKGVSLIIVPDDCIGLLPFEALVLNDTGIVKLEDSKILVSDAEFLGDRHKLSYAQSVTALTLGRQRDVGRQAGEGMLVVADPVFELRDERAQSADPGKIARDDKEYFENLMATIEGSAKGAFRFSRLPETLLLADNLSQMFGSNLEKMTGLNASKSNFLKAATQRDKDYRWIVLATHGLFSKQVAGISEPFLALTMVPPGTDGFLRMSEIMSSDIPVDLVALTACQTGLGKELSGEGVMSMGRAFQFAGARSVLMSLWSVSEKSSVMLIEGFFKNLKDGKPKPEALRMARDDVRKSGYDHPFFWAPFILVGETK